MRVKVVVELQILESGRARDVYDSTVGLADVRASVNIGLDVAESLPAGSGEDWLCW